MSNVISVSSLPYNLPSNEQEQLRILAKIIGFKPELLVGAGKVEVDAICSMILYRHLSQKQRVDAMKLIRSVSNRALMGKLVTGALDTTFVNPQYGMWSMTEKELQSDKDFHSFLDNFASYIGIGAYFGAFRSVISGLSDHPFRFKPITDSAIIRSLLA
ncbi:hypothetical protein J4H72_22900 [Vibrio alginolyticus]|uniref:hypothetical protein n=1 Tax=Vibrio alginolyticus TaxID=663 RepID=UPI001BD6196C|nr:hypothetical protein [Vibrio alginolyticus]MBT0110521.1 hypothetical protein [Vibrio alginolyticus]